MGLADMKRWLRARLFSVMWDLGDWAMRHALDLDDSERSVCALDGTLPANSTNSANCTTTRVTR